MSWIDSGKVLEGGIVPDVAPLLNRWRGLVVAAPLLLMVFSPLSARAIDESPALAGKSALFSASPRGAAALPLLIEQLLHEQEEAGDGSDRLAVASSDAAVVRLLYYERGYRPLWTSRARMAELIAAVGASSEHGLAPADFAIDALRQAAAAGGDDPAFIVRRDLLFTDALVRLARQLHYGKVNPNSLYSTWSFSPVPGAPERAQMLGALLEAASLQNALTALAPQDEAYRALQKALSRLSALAAGGGWASVPAGPTIRPGERGPRVRALRARLQAEGWMAAAVPVVAGADGTRYDKALVAGVERFQSAHGLSADGVVGSATLATLNVSAAERAAQVRVNLERQRWVARDMVADRLLVDITGFNAELRLDGATVWSSKVVVGRPARATPVLLDEVQHLVLNPKWVVPPTILKQDVIPGVIGNAGYLQKHRLRVVDRSGQAVAAAQVDWNGVARTGFPYRVVQESGAGGALGQVKFSLSNGYAIYLHDTPSRAQFGKPLRALSSGCVRLEKPRDLALLLLGDPDRWSKDTLDAAIATGRTQTLSVGRYVPVMLLYRTAVADPTGLVSFRADIYNQDGPVLALLDRQPRP
ncbi:L,D-transpeptidase family protein [Candidatus Accumulibacter sp. ACC003]|uniref:L,D-transpeptidase family protein n=1 Tax=Candidatus Accumulibacter sp. ACC003 TaxID=2823334 RepID=UPI0025BEA9BB|nr:L,D-transpeptidase family protein [Candidatus Accumulibacter sp. ACC003]